MPSSLEIAEPPPGPTQHRQRQAPAQENAAPPTSRKESPCKFQAHPMQNNPGNRKKGSIIALHIIPKIETA
jgi:hypothetical protein